MKIILGCFYPQQNSPSRCQFPLHCDMNDYRRLPRVSWTAFFSCCSSETHITAKFLQVLLSSRYASHIHYRSSTAFCCWWPLLQSFSKLLYHSQISGLCSFLDWCFRFHSISLSVLNFPLFGRIEYLSSIMFRSRTKYLAFSLFLGHSWGECHNCIYSNPCLRIFNIENINIRLGILEF